MHTRLNLEVTGLTGFPAQPWVEGVKLILPWDQGYSAPSVFQYEAVNMYTTQLEVTYCGGKKRRVFVVQPQALVPFNLNGQAQQGLRSAFMIGLCGSDSNGNAALDLLTPPASDYQYRWPIAVAKDNMMFAILVDGPVDGQYEYPDEFNSSKDMLIGDICGVEAARWYVKNSPSLSVYGIQPPTKNCFVGGISSGGVRSAFLSAALTDCVATYLAGTQLNKSYDTRPWCCPPEWTNYNYADMLTASNSVKTRIAFGGNGADYLYTPFRPDIDNIVDGLVAANPAKFSKHINTSIGHQIDLADVRSFFLNSMSYPLFYHVPEYEP